MRHIVFIVALWLGTLGAPVAAQRVLTLEQTKESEKTCLSSPMTTSLVSGRISVTKTGRPMDRFNPFLCPTV